jgi:hypothetical protein
MNMNMNMNLNGSESENIESIMMNLKKIVGMEEMNERI